MAGKKSDGSRTSTYRLAGMGMELAGAVLGGCVIGWYVDRQFEIEARYGLLTGALIGIVGGMYNLIRQAMKTIKDDQQRGDESTDDMGGDH